MLEYFNQQLPDDFEYKRSETNNAICGIAAKKDSEFTISDCKPILTDHQLKMINQDSMTAENLEKMLVIALETVELDENSGSLLLAEKKVPFKYLVRRADDDGAANEGRFYLQKCPLEFDMPLTCGETHITVHFTQKSSGNIDVLQFESENQALSMCMKINLASQTTDYLCSLNNAAEPDAKRCRNVAVIIDGMRKGTTVIDGFGKINPTPNETDGHELASFWNKVVEVEEALNVKFNANEAVDKMTFRNIERLRRCVCEGKAVGLGFKPDSISLNADEPTLPSKGEICRLLFPSEENLIIFGDSFSVYSNIGLEGIILGDPKQIDKTNFEIPVTYAKNFQCSILYLATKSKGSTEEDVQRISDTLFAPLPEGRKY